MLKGREVEKGIKRQEVIGKFLLRDKKEARDLEG